MPDLCVGAVSRRVIEEAAKLRVPQIIASRNQVDIGGGYTGWDQAELVATVKVLSQGQTKVVRDHGGPTSKDDGVMSLDMDYACGFDSLHLDVSAKPRDAQLRVLRSLVDRYAHKIDFEIGGERDDQNWLYTLLDDTLKRGRHPTHAILATGAHIWAERQRGCIKPAERAWLDAVAYRVYDVKTKSHNMDWWGGRQSYVWDGYEVLDAYNVAPEFARIEIEEWLRVLPRDVGRRLLMIGYTSYKWKRWFGTGEGTLRERAVCAAHYVLETDEVRKLIEPYDDAAVRVAIRDAIRRG